MAGQQTPAQRLLGDFAPKMVQLTDDVLFGDVWKRPGLSPARDREAPPCEGVVSLAGAQRILGLVSLGT